MNTYNNFNELAAGQATLVSDMSVFNAHSVTMSEAEAVVKACAESKKQFMEAVKAFKAMRESIASTGEYNDPVYKYLSQHDSVSVIV